MEKLPEGWEWKKLGSIAEINPKNNLSLPNDCEVSFLPMSSVQELTGKILTEEVRKLADVKKGYTAFQDNDVIFAKITPCMENGKIAVVQGLTNGVGYGSTEFHVIRPSNHVLNKFIFHYLIQEKIRKKAEVNMTGSAGQRRVPSTFLKNLDIPLPPLETQRNIVAILDKVEETKQLRAQANEQAQKLLQSVFLEMFGDPIKNPYGFPTTTFGELAVMHRYGPRFYNQPYSENGIPILRTTDINDDGSMSLHNAPRLDINREEQEKYRLKKGDIVVTRSGCLETSLGRCAIFLTDDICCIPGAFLLHFRFCDSVLPEFMHHLILTASFQQKIKNLARAAAQPNINAKELMSIIVPVPPINLQGKFADFLSVHNDLKKKQSKSSGQIDLLYRTIENDAFTGGLFTLG